MKKRFYSFFFCMILISTLLWPAAVFAGGIIGAAEYTVKKNEDDSFTVSFHTPLASGEYWCWAAFSEEETLKMPSGVTIKIGEEFYSQIKEIFEEQEKIGSAYFDNILERGKYGEITEEKTITVPKGKDHLFIAICCSHPEEEAVHRIVKMGGNDLRHLVMGKSAGNELAKNIPKTGDEEQPMLWISMCLICLVIMSILETADKRERTC